MFAAHILGLVLEPHFEVTVRRAVVVGVRIAVGWRAQVAARLALARLIIIALTGRHMHDTDGLPIFNGCNGMRRQADYHGTRGFFLILWVASALNTY